MAGMVKSRSEIECCGGSIGKEILESNDVSYAKLLGGRHGGVMYERRRSSIECQRREGMALRMWSNLCSYTATRGALIGQENLCRRLIAVNPATASCKMQGRSG